MTAEEEREFYQILYQQSFLPTLKCYPPPSAFRTTLLLSPENNDERNWVSTLPRLCREAVQICFDQHRLNFIASYAVDYLWNDIPTLISDSLRALKWHVLLLRRGSIAMFKTTMGLEERRGDAFPAPTMEYCCFAVQQYFKANIIVVWVFLRCAARLVKKDSRRGSDIGFVCLFSAML